MHVEEANTRGSVVLDDFLQVRCPRCSGEFDGSSAKEFALTCSSCGMVMAWREGIWYALSEEHASYYEDFIKDYEHIRAAEGRGNDRDGYYLRLPYVDASEKNAAQWAIRARTFDFLQKQILPPLIREGARNVLDLGAGNCWLSYRLSQMGMRAVAVDLLTNSADGLGAAAHYDSHLPRPFLRFRADCNALPFCDEQFDLAIFNASFHYAENYERMVEEALRCLRPKGTLLIADTPWYAKEESGEQMVEERQQIFTRLFGTASNSLHSKEFVTDSRLDRLAKIFGLMWMSYTPNYGLRWSLRPWIAKLKRRREPSTFRIYLAKKPA